MTDVTPLLEEFRRVYEADSNAWWRLESGHHMNLFDAALDALDAARARIAELEGERDEIRADAGRAHGNAGALHARVMELRAQVTARDARVAELEAAQRPPLGYVVLSKRAEGPDPTGFRPRVVSPSIWKERERAEEDRAEWREFAAANLKQLDGVEYILGEIREVQP